MSAKAVVKTGLERLIESGPEMVRLDSGTRIGLLAHPASVDRRGRHAVDLLREHPGLEPVRLFAPEHGVRGEAQDMEAVDEMTDRFTGLPVTSFYGNDIDSLCPDPADLEGIDAIVCDLQDVGSRYYTFVYTLSLVMEAAAQAGLPVVVLDRPNPIGGVVIEGPVLDSALFSFVGRYRLPARHGMTIAELARMFNERAGIGCDLRIVPMSGWRRDMYFDETGQLWVPPSPNMPTIATAAVYPGGCLVEGTNLSEGRGTTCPFENIGAPWLRGPELARAMETEQLDGVVFRQAAFRPMFQKHAGQSCGGLFVHVTDRKRFRPFAAYLAIIREARTIDPETFDWRREPYEFVTDRLAIDLLLGMSTLRPMIEDGATLVDMGETWREELETFLVDRKPSLLYPE